jgi:hypothetical protein
MSRVRSLPGQKSLFPEPVEETIRALPAWPDAALLQLARHLGYELIRRGNAIPAALPIGEAMAGMSAIADVTLPA